MPEPFPAERTTVAAAKFRHGLDVSAPTLKILLYTDDPAEVVPDDPGNKLWGLGWMLEHLHAHSPAFGKFDVKWVSRSSSPAMHADQKLDEVLEAERQTGHPFDEIWFFGLHQTNKAKTSLGVFRGGPESELTEKEISTLDLWMKAGGTDKSVGGGVLMTGDHNHDRPPDAVLGTNPACRDGYPNEQFLGRGRALGRCVPRAGMLRKWESRPTNNEEDSNDTTARSGADTDSFPQELILRKVNLAGDPDRKGQPHPIFRYKPGRWIEFFPDHLHEGEVTLPSSFDVDLWPGQTRPHVVARGIDRRRAELVDLVMTYNGEIVNLGRIVADSSWHHYFNLNLASLRHPALPGSAADQIGQFYANLAVWLAPPQQRFKMALAMLWRLAKYTAVMEPLGNVQSIGTEAYAILLQIASPCEVHELIQVLTPARYGSLPFSEKNADLSHVPSQRLLLGCLMDAYHAEMIRDEQTDASSKPRDVNEIIESAFISALTEHAKRLGLMAWETLKLISLKSE